MRLHDTGILKHLQDKYFVNLTRDTCGQKVVVSSSQINLVDLWPLFAVLAGGIVAGLVTVVAEKVTGGVFRSCVQRFLSDGMCFRWHYSDSPERHEINSIGRRLQSASNIMIDIENKYNQHNNKQLQW